MKIERYNENIITPSPYELTKNGELKKVDKELYGIKYVYLTDEQYNELKNISNNTKEMCDLLDQKKEVYIKIVIAAIQKVKKGN